VIKRGNRSYSQLISLVTGLGNPAEPAYEKFESKQEIQDGDGGILISFAKSRIV
jgi:hypothetical protein